MSDLHQPPILVERSGSILQGIARVSIVAALSTLLLGIAVRSGPPDPVNVPVISADGRLFYLLTLGAAALVGVMAQRAERAREALAAAQSRFVGESVVPAPSTAWILPALTVFGALLLVARNHRGVEIAAITLLAASGVFASLTVRENLPARVEDRVNLARVAHVALTVAVAFVVLTLLFMFRMRTLYSGSAIFVVSMLLLVQVHDGIDTWPVRKLAYGAIGALALAEVTWALNYWPPIGWHAGALLAAAFVGVCLTTGSRLANTLNTERVALYAGGVAAVALAVTVLSW